MKITPYYWIPLMLAGIIAILFFARTSDDDKTMTSETSADSTRPNTNTIASEFMQPSTTTTPSHAQKKNASDYIHPEFQERFNTMKERRPNTDFDAAAVEAAINRENLWATTATPAKDLPLKPEEFTDGRQFVNFDTLKMETLMPGDSFKITIDELKQNYEVIIDRIEQHDYENISWHGHIEAGDGQNYSVSFTQSANITVGGLDTPEGNYVIQAQGTNGWIASSGLLFKVDPEVSDIAYPPEEEL